LISASNGGIIEITSTIMKNLMNNVNDGGGIVMDIESGMKLIMNETCEINTVQATNGNGGGLYLTQSGTGKVNITGMIVKSCEGKSASGRGGGIHLTTTDGNADLTLSSLSFEGNGPQGIKGKDIYVICDDIVNVVMNKFSFMTTSIGEGLRTDSFWGKQTTPFTNELDLFIFLTGFHSSPFYLSPSSSNNDVDYCGISDFKCNSLSYLFMNKNVDENSDIYVFLDDGDYHENGMNVNGKKYEITKTEEISPSIVPSSSSVQLFTVSSGSLSLTSLSLVPIPSLSLPLITISSSGSLSLSNCHVQPISGPISLSTSLISISGGWREEVNERRKEFCDWDSSLLHFSSSSHSSSLKAGGIRLFSSFSSHLMIEERKLKQWRGNEEEKSKGGGVDLEMMNK
jgi:hypothetical protein